MIKVTDCTNMEDAELVANYIEERCHTKGNSSRSKKHFYCGITDNPDRRAEEHKVDSFLCCVKCKSYTVSSEVEKILAARGFDCGKKQGMGNKDSVYVYIYDNIILD